MRRKSNRMESFVKNIEILATTSISENSCSTC